MTETMPPLPPYEEEGYMIAEPRIAFTIERIVRARRNEIYRAWTDPETFKRWIVAPSQELVSYSFEPQGRTVWSTKSQTDSDVCVEYIVDVQTHWPYKALEAQCFTSAVRGMRNEHPVYLHLTLRKRRVEDRPVSTNFKLELSYHHATLWHYTSCVDLHTFWLDATERLTQLVEQDSVLSGATA
ncbi:SRPBCC domain-containing protein [Methylobacterium soli]|nr:SRPBCC domain-containing protein [Methylobacterium soli]GJE41593.1 hypothetical protein AEGHOMDF_0759 [Methylobacterium soli]